MTPRSIGLVGVVGICVVTGLLAVEPLAAQAPVATTETAVSANAWTMSRTPDGQPDLQGFWTNSNYTPLERPDDVSGEFYTPEEVAAIEDRRAQREAAQTDPRTIPDVHYDFTQFGLDRSQSTFASNLRTSLIVDPPNGKMPPLTAEGERRAEERAAAREARGGRYDRAENASLGERCLIMRGAGPPMMNAGYNSNYHIVQASGYVMILVEMIHDARIIPLDGRGQPSERARQWMGMSRGRWDGDTLVVETTNFNGKNPFRGSSEHMKVTERFTRVSEDTIQYRFTVEDESVWTRPWTAEMPMKKTIGPIFEHACHEGNYGLTNILAGARAEEHRAAEGTSSQR